MRVQVVCAVAILSCVVLAGCAETRGYEGYREELASWSYAKHVGVTFKDWGFDALDVVSFEVGIGETIGINIQPTEILQVGALFGDTMKFGLRDRGLGFYRDTRKEGGFTGLCYYRDMVLEPITGTRHLFERQRVFKGFPIRSNEEWHWADLGAEVGLVIVQGSAHVSPKQALDFAVTTVSLPLNLIVRPLVLKAGRHFPDIDICDDDTAAQLRRKHGVELIRHPEGFPPMEFINDLIDLGY